MVAHRVLRLGKLCHFLRDVTRCLSKFGRDLVQLLA